ncbi:hypothetical protein RFI_06646 [Reticulomyxa filosa]|uniref:Fe2OG dioxygenase domain-containing protein n=1 Tax=Reticulomyxa filosa TaxID=46433 RepID=X6NYX7_RETFI|nr:hypothetical protein RFI_06646 [Reticulomyxa filosa]|eukprot:ETO30477.1 hypothetical protein RFI_06646 [Reticulomyxa filosa]
MVTNKTKICFSSHMIVLVLIFISKILVNASENTGGSDIPVVDLSKSKYEVAQNIRNVAKDFGFFYLINHNISQVLLSKVFNQSMSFFNLSELQKLSVKQRDGYFGYTPFEEEVLDKERQYNRGDTKEGYYVRGPFANKERRPLQWETLWIDEKIIPEFKATTLEYYYRLKQLSLRLTSLIALSLNLEENFFDNKFQNPLDVLRLLHYTSEPSNISSGIFGAGQHTDYGMFTILAVLDHVSGLQIYPPRLNRWIDVPRLENAFIVNLGDQLQRWTNDYYHSTLHRVVIANTSVQRYSVAFFWEPDFECLVSCVPTICNEQELPKYEPVMHGEHLLFKFSQGHTQLDLKTEL